MKACRTPAGDAFIKQLKQQRKEAKKMTATKYALVPVVATDEMADAGCSKDGVCYISSDEAWLVYSAMLAAAPKELPEEVVENMSAAYLSGYAMRTLEALNDGRKSVADAKKEAHRAGIRAALLAVMGG